MITFILTRSLIALSLALTISASSHAGASELLDAIKANDIAQVRALISAGADANEKSSSGGPLNIAAGQGSVEIVTALIDAGANLETPGFVGLHPLHAAAKAGQMEIAKLLIARGAIVDALDDSGRTPLIIAISSPKTINVIKVLLAAGANRGAEDRAYHRNALFWAVFEDRLDVVDALLATGLDVNIKDSDQDWTALHLAVAHFNYDIVQFLIDHGADVNIAGKNGETPLQIAKERNSKQMLEILAKAGAK